MAVLGLVESLQVTKEEMVRIERETVGQIYNDEWKIQRRNRLTASNAGKVFKMRDTTSNKNTLQQILYPTDLSHNDNIVRGINLEPIAKEFYSTIEGTDVEECGLFISEENGVLGASPDGLIGQHGILEVKCPNCKPEDIPNRNDKFLIKIPGTNKLQINVKHRYYHQVVMQIHVCQKLFCDFLVYFESADGNQHYFLQRIKQDAQTLKLWNEMKSKLIKFYTEDMSVEIVDPIYPTENRFRQPLYRVQAMEAIKSKKSQEPPEKDGVPQVDLEQEDEELPTI